MNINAEIIRILENNHIKPILSGDPRFLATIRIYDEEKLENVLADLKILFNNFKSYSLSYHSIKPCCAPSFKEIRYKITL
ncbi:hypothetical protein SDC9_08388 [bioreactor metagenome]|uniref:Uncharacterized protein n=1 Tax=bioreactor metagenome TaxID=1076179 RepID=A0A644T781_9ZZZZ|nr:hypothetical protein [Methanobrevibacter sp.]MEA4957307.1 hypothetical protein [Methanobrevibacter sp.]